MIWVLTPPPFPPQSDTHVWLLAAVTPPPPSLPFPLLLLSFRVLVAQAGLYFMILLLQPLERWDCRSAHPGFCCCLWFAFHFLFSEVVGRGDQAGPWTWGSHPRSV